MKYKYQCIFDFNEIDEEHSNLNCYFIFENTEIFTKENKLIFKMQIESDENKVVDVLASAATKSRPILIALLDVISFLTGITVTIYNIKETSSFSSSISKKAEILPENEKTHFIYDNVDITKDLDKIINSLTKQKFLVASVLDKWNKANFLIKSDEASVLFVDEAILNYLHIFELLSDTTKKDYNLKIENELDTLLKNFFNRIGFDTDQVVNSKIENKKKTTKEILVGSFLPFNDKLKFFLKTNGLLDENTLFLVDNLIKLRNNIAHGRMVYNMDIMAYPLTPFYNISTKDNELVEPLMILTAVSISKYIGISLWEDEWIELKKNLQPSNTRIIEYINGNLEGININSEDISNINWYSLFKFYISCNDKLRKKIELKVKSELEVIPFEDLLIPYIFELSVVLSTTKDKELFSILEKIIKIAIKEKKYFLNDFRDMLPYLESQNFDTKKLNKNINDIIIKTTDI